LNFDRDLHGDLAGLGGLAEIGQPTRAVLCVSDNRQKAHQIRVRAVDFTMGDRACALAADWLFTFSHVWSGEVVATSNQGATMADKLPGKSLRKSAQSIKERRAAKRAKAIESTPIVRKRKG
jgi:hypothetical protein